MKTIQSFKTVLLLIFILTTPIFTQTPTVELKFDSWIRTWQLCGPIPLGPISETTSEVQHLPGFEKDYLRGHGGEAYPTAEPGAVITFNGGSAECIIYTSQDSVIDLDEAVSKQENVLAYASCEIVSPQDRVCLLSIGSNDGGRAWLNGEQIWDYPEPRGLVPDDDAIPVLLQKGKNTLVLKIEERGNQWGFCVRFLPLDVENFIKAAHPFCVVTHLNGQSVLRFIHAESVIKQILESATIEVFADEESQQPVWSGIWNKKKEMAVEVDPEQYKKYTLKLSARLTDGNTWTIKIPFVAGKRIEHLLFEKGKTNYTIVISEKASESEQWAAQELRHWLKEVSGADFKVRFDSYPLAKNEIVVGFNQHAKALLGASYDALRDDDESFTYKNIGESIIIWGGRQRGTMYGVMSFLERELGCRWFTPRVSVIPQKEKYSFTYLDHSETPGIRVRNDFYYEAFDPIWAARNKINGAMGYRVQPGGVECYWAVHTFYRLMPPSEFFDEHPEYYSLIDGKRTADHAQLCLTNPDVLRIITERLQQVMRENPEYLIYSLSQNDWRNPCQCDNCQAISKREGSESGPLIWFVNQVAENIEKEFPHKFIGTLAYQYTRKPPKTIRPRHNVVIRLCSIECCFAHDFKSCPENQSFLADLTGWSAISPHLYIWDYVVNFSHYIMPYPNFRVLQPNIQTFRDNKAIGIMEQAAYQSRGGEFAELRAYVISKLLWNPECDVEQVINDFMYGYYGRAGQYIRQYFDYLHNQLRPDTHIHLGLTPDDKLFSDEFVRQAEAIFDQAEKVADNEEIRERVEMARLPVMYLKCRRSPMQAKYDGTYQRFNTIIAREGITHYAERGEMHRKAFHRWMEEVQ